MSQPSDKPINLSDPDFEPTDADLHLIAKLAGDKVREETRRLRAAGLLPPEPQSTAGQPQPVEDALTS